MINNRPWLAEPAIKEIEKWNIADWKVFEWGSGGSTIWFGKRVRQMFSVEHDLGWFRKVSKEIENHSLPVKLIHKMKNTSSYVKVIGTYNSKLDLVIVDGRNRVACVKEALKTPPPILIFDNGMREKYKPAKELLDKYYSKMKEFDYGNGKRQSNTLIYYE